MPNILPANTSGAWERSLRHGLLTQVMLPWGPCHREAANKLWKRATELRKYPPPHFPWGVSPSNGFALPIHSDYHTTQMVAKWPLPSFILAQKSTTSVPSATRLYVLASSKFTLIISILSYPDLHPLQKICRTTDALCCPKHLPSGFLNSTCHVSAA